MKEYITVTANINGAKATLKFRKEELLIEFKASQFYTNTNNPKYWLTIREFITWKIIKNLYEGNRFKELRKLGI